MSKGNSGTETYPAPFEAVLRAEVAILYAKFKARWALQAPSIILAIHPETFPLCACFCHSYSLKPQNESRRKNKSIQFKY